MSLVAVSRTKPSVLLQSCVSTCTAVGLLASAAAFAAEPQAPAQQLIQQQQRERAQREQLEPSPDVRLQAPQDTEASLRLPRDETPCFKIDRVVLSGDQAEDFQWALRAANPSDDPVQGRCVGARGINLTMKRIQNAIIAKGMDMKLPDVELVFGKDGTGLDGGLYVYDFMETARFCGVAPGEPPFQQTNGQMKDHFALLNTWWKRFGLIKSEVSYDKGVDCGLLGELYQSGYRG